MGAKPAPQAEAPHGGVGEELTAYRRTDAVRADQYVAFIGATSGEVHSHRSGVRDLVAGYGAVEGHDVVQAVEQAMRGGMHCGPRG